MGLDVGLLFLRSLKNRGDPCFNLPRILTCECSWAEVPRWISISDPSQTPLRPPPTQITNLDPQRS